MLEAQEALVQLKIVKHPHTSSESQRRTHKEFHRAAYPKTHDPSKKVTTEQLAARIAAVIGGK